MSATKTELTGWDVSYDNIAGAASPGDTLRLECSKEGGRTSFAHEWEEEGVVDEVGDHELTLENGDVVRKSGVDVVHEPAGKGWPTGGGNIDRVVVE